MRGIRYRGIIFRTLAVLVVAALIVAASAVAFARIESIEEERCWQVLEDSAQAINSEVNIIIEDNINVLKIVSAVAEHDGESHGTDVLAEHVNAFQEMTMFRRIDILYPDGTLHFSDGETKDVSAAISFEEIVRKGEHLSERMTDITDPSTQVVCCFVPVHQHGEATAVLVGVIDCSTLSEAIHGEVYSGQANIGIIDSSDGAFILDSWHDAPDNLYTETEQKEETTQEDADLISGLRHGQTGAIIYPVARKNADAYVYYTPVGTSDWELLIVVQEHIAFASLIKIRRILTVIELFEILLLVVYSAMTLLRANRLAKEKKVVEHNLMTSNTLIECIRMLSQRSEADAAINGLLEIVNSYFGGDRTYLFEIDYQAETTSNTYEYAVEGVTKEIDNLQNVPISAIEVWLKKFHETGTFCISDLDDDVDKTSSTYEILAAQNIHRLIAVPLIENDVIIGFFGVDNPKQNYSDFSLISSATYFLVDNLEKRRQQRILEQMSFEDGLTRLYNRNKFNQVVESYKNQHPRQLGIAFFDLNGLKVTNDKLGHAAGDKLIRNAGKAIRYVFGENAFRIGGDEFAVIVADILQEPFIHDVKKASRMMRENEVSVSVGYSWRGLDTQIHEQLHEADERMYEDKKRYYENAATDRRRRDR